MAVVVVDRLEEIDIDEDHAQRLTVAVEAIHFLARALFETAPVPGTGEFVGAGYLLEFDHGSLQLLVDLLQPVECLVQGRTGLWRGDLVDDRGNRLQTLVGAQDRELQP